MGIKFHVLSDLHLEHKSKFSQEPLGDAVIIAGDVARAGDSVNWIRNWVGDKKPVFFVAGNHEFYFEDYAEAIKTMKEDAVGGSCEFLENTETHVGDVRILGATLWTDYLLYGESQLHRSMDFARLSMNDHLHIYRDDEKRRFTPEDARGICLATKEWLQNKLHEKHDACKTIVITHHGPVAEHIPEQYAGSALNPAFHNDWSSWLKDCDFDLWIYGHTHFSQDFMLDERRRFVCNPRGYPFEQRGGFRPDLVIDL